jgi:hypothetical protein
MDPNGGLAIAGIDAQESAGRALEVSRGIGSDVTTNRLFAGLDPVGKLSISTASPPGWSIRRPQVRPLDPGRVDVKSSQRPSGDQRGFELS